MMIIFTIFSGMALAFQREEGAKMEEKPVLKECGGVWLACMDFTGPYNQIGKKAKIFREEFEKQGLKGNRDFWVAYYNSPRYNKPEDLGWSTAFAVDMNADVKPPLKKREFKKTQCVTIVHRGPIPEIQKSNDKVKAFIDNNGLEMVWPAYEIFYSEEKVAIIHPVRKKKAIPPGMVLVEGGSFQMGDKEISSNEDPVHAVTLPDFYIGKYEVTQEEWQAVMGDNPSLFKGEKHPVDTVSWYDIIDYCNKRSEKEGRTPCYTRTGDDVTCDFNADGYRLPTEAEWEYACRGGEKSRNYRYSGGNDADQVAWYDENSADRTHAVGGKKANELGIYDMSGNAWEWCWDWFDPGYYKTGETGPVQNPTGPPSGANRSYRGGGAAGQQQWLRGSARFNLPPGFENFVMGFRVAASGKGKAPGGLVFVKGGTFNMGDSLGTNGEKIVHTAAVGSFYMSRYEVTQEEWRAVMNSNPSFKKGAKSPVNYVDWYQAIEYCNKRSVQEGLTPCYSGSGDGITCNFNADGYRLPTEAEWEYACRGGVKSKNYTYSGGNNADEVAWHNQNTGYLFVIRPVGQKMPNELGLYDMSGNVIEWCWDWYDFYYYKESPVKNPAGPKAGIRRVTRGGHWFASKDTMHCASRACNEPFHRSMVIGFRVVRKAN
jgi:formylglycine-generating enzyme required for sulfatase activity